MEENEEESIRSLVMALREEVKSLAALITRKRALEEGTHPGTISSSSAFCASPTAPPSSLRPNKRSKRCFSLSPVDNDRTTNGGQSSVDGAKEQEFEPSSTSAVGPSGWGGLPEELVTCLFSAMDPLFVAIAARTCRSWFVCAPQGLKNRLHQLAVAKSGSLALLQWAVANGCPLDASLSACLALEGQLELLKWARWNGCKWDRWTCCNAAQAGHLEVLRWARKNGCSWNEECCELAARHGHLEVVKWLRRHGCHWDERTTQEAASSGHFELFRWAIAHGCPCFVDDLSCVVARRGEKELLVLAAREGHVSSEGANRVCAYFAMTGDLELLRWARDQGFPWTEEVCSTAARSKHLALLKWARENGCPWRDQDMRESAVHGGLDVLKFVVGQGVTLAGDPCVCALAARRGSLEMVQWAKENGCPWDATFMAEATKTDHLEIVKWARENGCPWDSRAMMNAAVWGDLKRCQWLKQHGCPWNAETTKTAASKGDLRLLQWAQEHGCPWDIKTSIAAAESGNLGVLQWALKNGCPWNAQEICDAAAGSGKVEVLHWALEELGCEWEPRWMETSSCFCAMDLSPKELTKLVKLTRKAGAPWSAGMFTQAATEGYVEVLRWLRKKGCPWDETTCAAAAVAGHLDALKWLHEHGCPWDGRTFKHAIETRQLEMAHWLLIQRCPLPRRGSVNVPIDTEMERFVTHFKLLQ
ncbi:Ankyrin repeat domain containing protein [Balamuthia mandrillaris]